MQYLLDTNGDFKQFIEDHTSIAAPASQILKSVRYRDGVGFYGLSHYGGRAYLSACITPMGESTLTREQFRQALAAYDQQPRRLLAWLLAQDDLRDRRCLWSHLSLPTADGSPEIAYQKLETTWLAWYKWWKPRFPQL
jgi:cyanosortase A-associated protein